MSSGHIHTKASLLLTGGFIVTSVLTWDISGLSYAAGSLLGVMVTPDCDVDGGTVSDKYIRRRLGKVFEKGWDGLWYFYRRSLKHGGELSHFPLIGTMGRIVYLFACLIIVPHIASYVVFSPSWDLWYVIGWYWDRLWEGWRVILGLAGADFIHYILDQTDLLIRDLEIKMGLRKRKPQRASI